MPKTNIKCLGKGSGKLKKKMPFEELKIKLGAAYNHHKFEELQIYGVVAASLAVKRFKAVLLSQLAEALMVKKKKVNVMDPLILECLRQLLVTVIVLRL